ncbi:MAG: hypothetical protein Q7T36_05760 [Fluviicoccus sp.]|uniref:tetratricopeptide repeat protein n=1 Tax=Fluviicoccus sp. TaxID=2003552 RepID=UPI00271B058E|nr:hypothetical protein [Fluviicoccus sp.]MDO8329960.1 hypothetical protein [Fluviicoccus sp.]
MTNLVKVPDEVSCVCSGPSSLRFGVFDITGGGRKAIAKLELSVNQEGSCELKISSESEEAISRISELTKKNRTEGRAEQASGIAAEELLERGGAILREMLVADGYEVEELPVGDHQISLTLNMRTGSVVGVHEALHEAVGSGSEDLAKKIFDSVTEGIKSIHEKLASEVLSHIEQGRHLDAITLLSNAFGAGQSAFPASASLLQALLSVDISVATDDQRQVILKWRISAAEFLGRHDVAASAAEEFLSKWRSTLSAEQSAAIQMIIASGMMKRGSKESALMVWRTLLDAPQSLGAENRAWAWRNISVTLLVDDPESMRAARSSADAFLEAGNKEEAAKSLMQVAKCLLHSEPIRALDTIDEILPLLDESNLVYRSVKAAVLHARADRLMKMARYSEAASDAQAAVAAWRGLLGKETDLVHSLYLASFAAESAGNEAVGISLKDEADKLAAALPTSRFTLASRLSALSENFSAQEAKQLEADAECEGDSDVKAAVRQIRALMDTSLSESTKLMLLEEELNDLKLVNTHSPMVQSLQCAIGIQLMKMSQFKRAREWFEKVLEAEPLDIIARDHLLGCLWQMEAWADAVLFLKDQLKLHGEMPGLLFAYGRSMYEAGDMVGAIFELQKVLELADPASHLSIKASEMCMAAIKLVGKIPPSAPKSDPTLPVSLEEFEQELNRFSVFVAGAKRMVFWTKPDDADYSWITKPERQAQNLLHTFLKARFLERIGVFEEIATGAGRLDIYVQLHGGLSAVLELKMCGFGYTSAYAAAGEEQIVHYMSNRRTSIGYLVVFDARLENFGDAFADKPKQDLLTIKSQFIDVRPRVSTRTKKKP